MADDLKSRLAAASNDPDAAYAAEARRRYKQRFGEDPPTYSAAGPYADNYRHSTRPEVNPFDGADTPPAIEERIGAPRDRYERLAGRGGGAYLTGHPDIPEPVRQRGQAGNAGIMAGAFAGAGTGALLSRAGLMPVSSGVLSSVASGAAARGTEAAAQGRNPLPEMVSDELVKQDAYLGGAVPLVGSILDTVAAVPRAGADAIRNSKTVTGEDIRVLEKFGSEPAPVPGIAAFNPPTRQLNVAAQPKPVVGVSGKTAPPKPRPDDPVVTADPHGRGLVGERGAKRLIGEVDTQDRMLIQRHQHKELPAATAKQGGRTISVQKYVDEVDRQLADPSVGMIPGLRGRLKKLRQVLAGEAEPSEIVWVGQEPEAHHIKGAPIEDANQLDPDWATSTVVGHDRLDGTPIVQEKFLNKSLGRTDDNWMVQGGGADKGETVRVGLGVLDEHGRPVADIRGRVGDAPNYVMSAERLNSLRDILDDLGGITAKETGLSKNELPFARLANEIRADIRREAPAIGLANRRHHDAKAKLERTKERMRTENDETLAMRLAGQSEQGAKTAGIREPGMLELRRNFPTSEHLPREEVDRIFDAPRALLAEERMKVVGNLAQIGGNTKTKFNLREPFVGRGIYPSLRYAEGGLDALGSMMTTPEAAMTAPIYLRMIDYDADQAIKRRKKKK